MKPITNLELSIKELISQWFLQLYSWIIRNICFAYFSASIYSWEQANDTVRANVRNTHQAGRVYSNVSYLIM